MLHSVLMVNFNANSSSIEKAKGGQKGKGLTLIRTIHLSTLLGWTEHKQYENYMAVVALQILVSFAFKEKAQND